MNRVLIFILLSLLLPVLMLGQTPNKCFEIESILVDACGNPEGANEMVTFRIGPNDLNVNDLVAAWPNTWNPFLGICQDAGTAAKVADLNASIQNCGFIKEPTSGILPAGSRVLLITSADFSTSANSFANLNDTLVIIFQCAGNTYGHFANATSSGSRTFVMTFSNPSPCGDTVKYNTQALVDINGQTGGGWPGNDRDGATVQYSWSGNANYTNHGCNIPVEPLFANAGQDDIICEGNIVILDGTVGVGDPVQWWGGSGSFGSPTNESTIYTPGPSDPNPLALYLQTWSSCESLIDTVLIHFLPEPMLDLGPDTVICPGQILTLSASMPGLNYLWSTGDTGMSISFGKPGIFGLSASNYCGTVWDTIVVDLVGDPWGLIVPDTVCGGDTIPIAYFGGASSITWLSSAGEILDDTAFVTSLVTEIDFHGPVSLDILADDSCGIVQDSIDLWVNEGIMADFSFQPLQDIYIGTLVEFIDESSPNPVIWDWEMGDGNHLNQQNPGYRYPLEGNYEVTLIAENIFGCKDTVFEELLVVPRDSLIPNVFTPNGDGVNDVFHIQLPVVLEYQMNIFDRWGHRWFRSSEADEVWDGRQGGRNAREGVYFFSLRAKTWREEWVEIAGTITLLR